MPSLTSVSGQLTVSNLNILSNLCQLGLQQTGYTASQAVRCPFGKRHLLCCAAHALHPHTTPDIHEMTQTCFFSSQVLIQNVPSLVQVPQWISTSANQSYTSCPASYAPIVIHNQDDFNSFLASSQAASQVVGPVVITWANITPANLAQVLQGKTSLGGLVLERLAAITTLNGLLDNISTIASDVVIDSMPALTDLSLAALTSTGGGIRFYSNPMLLSVSIPNVTSVPGDLYEFHSLMHTVWWAVKAIIL